MEEPLTGLTCRLADLEEIIPLRHAVIIAGTNRTRDYFPGDRDGGTLHFGAFLGGETAACLTLIPSEWESQPAYQLRGMATDPRFRGLGAGRALLVFAERYVLETAPVRRLWCNARVQVEGFYAKMGWKTVSEPFMIEGVCEHVKMVRDPAAGRGGESFSG